MKKKPITAEELMKQLESNKEFQARKRAKQKALAAREADFRKAEQPLIERLTPLGFQLSSIWDLVNSNNSYKEALPVLLEELGNDYPEPIREGIARSLAVKEARPYFDQLVNLYQKEQVGRVRDGLAVAISLAGDLSCFDMVVNLVHDTSSVSSKILLLSFFERYWNEKRAKDFILNLKSDEELSQECERIIRRKERG